MRIRLVLPVVMMAYFTIFALLMFFKDALKSAADSSVIKSMPKNHKLEIQVMKQVKVGIIGFGFMGTTHWGVYQGLKNAKVVAVADVDAAKRKGDISKVVGNIGGGDNSKPLDLSGVKAYAERQSRP